MRRFLLLLIFLSVLSLPVQARNLEEIPVCTAPDMPQQTGDLWEGLKEVLGSALKAAEPEAQEGARVCTRVVGALLLLSLMDGFPGKAKQAGDLAGATAVGGLLLSTAGAMIPLAGQTIQEVSQYGKLLLPVMTGAAAAQGKVTGSAALYTLTAFFDSLLSSFMAAILVPLVHVFLALACAEAALNQDSLKRLKDFIKWAAGWSLKTLLTLFTAFMGISNVISGTTDAAALKAARLTISGVVPVVGGILSDASEAVLVGAGVFKNAAGIYGLLAMTAILLRPFIRIGIHYLLMKLMAAIAGIIGSSRISGLIQDFSSALGLLLGAAGAQCLLMMVSLVCFMKGVSL